MKKYFFAVPYQPQASFHKVYYDTHGDNSLEYRDTHFPIIPVIANSVENNDSIKIIAIWNEHENVPINYATFLEELNELKTWLKEKNIAINIDIETIKVPYQESLDKNLGLSDKLLHYIDDNDELSACVTYASKIIPMILMMVLNYGYQLKDNVSIGKIVYGEFNFVSKKSSINDATSIFYMNSMMHNLAQAGSENPLEIISSILNS